MNELQAGIEFTLAVFPQPPILLQPGKAALNNPAFGHDLEGMQLTPLGNLHCDGLSQDFPHAFGKWFSGVAAVAQQTLYFPQARPAVLQRLQCAFAIGYLRRRHRNGMRQPLRIDRDMAFDARYFLASVITLLTRRVRVLHALRVHDQERAVSVAPLFLAGRANLIFLMPAPARLHRAGRAHSIYANRRTHSAIWEIRQAGTSIGNRCAADTAPHRIPRIDPPSWAWCCVEHCAEMALSRQIVLC